MIAISALLAVSAATLPGSQPSPEAWAGCIWDRVPRSAANWVALPVEQPVGFTSESRFQRLGFRLRSACWHHFFGKPEKLGLVSEPFDQMKVRDALIRTRPSSIGSDTAVEKSSVCRAFDGERIVAEYFGFASMKPYGGFRVECSGISEDGSLVDA